MQIQIKNYNYSVSGDISESNFKLLKPVKNSYITEKVNEIYLSDFKVKTVVEPLSVLYKINFPPL